MGHFGRLLPDGLVLPLPRFGASRRHGTGWFHRPAFRRQPLRPADNQQFLNFNNILGVGVNSQPASQPVPPQPPVVSEQTYQSYSGSDMRVMLTLSDPTAGART